MLVECRSMSRKYITDDKMYLVDGFKKAQDTAALLLQAKAVPNLCV
jgi:hypothetical protein